MSRLKIGNKNFDLFLPLRKTNLYSGGFMNKYSKKNIKGATMIEYVLLAGLISIAAAALLTPIGAKISALFTTINTTIP
jgi:Flp pilus assembly pilin Flp